MPEPLVSLAVPTFDRPRFLETFLASVEAEVRLARGVLGSYVPSMSSGFASGSMSMMPRPKASFG